MDEFSYLRHTTSINSQSQCMGVLKKNRYWQSKILNHEVVLDYYECFVFSTLNTLCLKKVAVEYQISCILALSTLSAGFNCDF